MSIIILCILAVASVIGVASMKIYEGQSPQVEEQILEDFAERELGVTIDTQKDQSINQAQ
jgi:hypothetical protein